ncbi:MAG: hypothetical protein IPG25_06270 [Proteobacteria bacterium]|nr:hypothetical protein [Pseudomonadota bacterium]
MTRRSEVVALKRDDVVFQRYGTGRALIRRSKTDQAWEGSTVYLSRTTWRYLKTFLMFARIRQGVDFRREIGRWYRDRNQGWTRADR